MSESESFTSCALPPSEEVTGLCLCMLGKVLDVGAEGTVQGGDVVACYGGFSSSSLGVDDFPRDGE